MKRFFTTSKFLKLAMVLGLVFVGQQVISYTNNPPVKHTGAPNENNCTSCHSGTAITSGTNYNDLEISTNMKNGQYIPDSVYDITIKYKESGKSKFGFMATMLETTNDTKSGAITITNSTRTAKSSSSVNGSSREYVYHKGSGTSGSGSISWDFEWKAPSKNEGDLKFYVALNSTNNNSGNSGDKIILKEFDFEPSDDLPTASITTNSTTVCMGDTFILDGTKSKNSTKYDWTVNGQAWTNNKKDSVIKAVWTKSGKFNVKLTTSNSIASSEEEKLQITVLESPADTISITGNDSICAGESVRLTATSSASKYTWSNNQSGQSINVSSSGTYYAIVEGSNGCKTKTEEVDITVVSPPFLNINLISNDTICSNEVAKFVATSGLTNYTYESMGLPLLNSNNDTVDIMIPPGNYEITARAENYLGCASELSNPLLVVVEPQRAAPQINCTNVGIEEVTAEWQSTPDILGYEVSIDSGKTWVSPNGTNTHLIDGLSFSTEVAYWLRGKTADICKYTSIETQVCKTQNCFNVSYNLVNDSVCTNQQEGRVEFNNLNLDKYSISFNGEAYASNSTFTYNVGDFNLGENTVDVSFIDSNALSCPAFDTTITISVNQSPSPEIFTAWNEVENRNRICLNDEALLLEGNSTENGMSYLNTEWLGDGVRALGGNQFEFNPSAAGAGTYVLGYEVTNIYGCTATNYDTVIVDSTKVASFTFSADQRLVSFTSTIEGATEVLWDFGDGNTSDELNPTHYYNADGTYTVKLETNDLINVCQDVSYTDDVAVIGGSIGEKSIQVEAYPNPFNETFNLRFEVADNYQIEVLDATGAIVFNGTTNATNFSINTSNLTNGVYLLRVSNKDRIYKSIIVK
jgi:hypothetical protein